MNTKFHIGIDRDEIPDEFDGQGHRSKIKVTGLKMGFQSFLLIGVIMSKVLAYSVTSQRHSMTS